MPIFNKTCPICGKTFEAKSQHTVYCSPECRKQGTENRWADRMQKRSEDTADLIGERNGKCVVIGPADPDPTYNRTRIMLRCDCGNEFPANLSAWRNRHTPTMCAKCSGMRTAHPYRDRTGEQIENLTILGMEGEWRGEYKTKYRVRCGLCGGESVMDGAHLLKNQKCAKCNRKNLDAGRKLMRSGDIDGTNVYAIQSSLDGKRKTNRNSSTGVTGVNKLGDDKYRAVIMFRRKQYHLGTFATIDEAAAVRKEAEEHLYGDFLAWYNETIEIDTTKIVIREWNRTHNLREVSRRSGLSVQPVRKLLIDNGIAPSEKTKEIMELAEQGLSVQEIAERVGISPKAVGTHLPHTKGPYTGESSTTKWRRSKVAENKKSPSGEKGN